MKNNKKKEDRLPRRWIKVVNPNGTVVETHREIEMSTRGGEYIHFAGSYYKLPTSGTLDRVKFGKGRDTLP